MCNLIDNFYEDLFFDLEYQEYLYNKKRQEIEQYNEYLSIEQHAYEIMAEQYFKDLEKFETLTEEKEYREIKEWELINQL